VRGQAPLQVSDDSGALDQDPSSIEGVLDADLLYSMVERDHGSVCRAFTADHGALSVLS
jgi:hypothetical protein